MDVSLFALLLQSANITHVFCFYSLASLSRGVPLSACLCPSRRDYKHDPPRHEVINFQTNAGQTALHFCIAYGYTTPYTIYPLPYTLSLHPTP